MRDRSKEVCDASIKDPLLNAFISHQVSPSHAWQFGTKLWGLKKHVNVIVNWSTIHSWKGYDKELFRKFKTNLLSYKIHLADLGEGVIYCQRLLCQSLTPRPWSRKRKAYSAALIWALDEERTRMIEVCLFDASLIIATLSTDNIHHPCQSMRPTVLRPFQTRVIEAGPFAAILCFTLLARHEH